MTTDKTDRTDKREATCSISTHASSWIEYGTCAICQPATEKAEWERLIDTIRADSGTEPSKSCAERALANLPAAVQRALDGREATTWTRAAGSVSDTMNTGKDTMLDAAAFVDFANEKAAAAEARAKGE